MELYEVLEKRRTYRDYSDREVSDEIVKKVIAAAFKAPTNDHLRQLEFVVVAWSREYCKGNRTSRKEYSSIQGTRL